MKINLNIDRKILMTARYRGVYTPWQVLRSFFWPGGQGGGDMQTYIDTKGIRWIVTNTKGKYVRLQDERKPNITENLLKSTLAAALELGIIKKEEKKR